MKQARIDELYKCIEDGIYTGNMPLALALVFVLAEMQKTNVSAFNRLLKAKNGIPVSPQEQIDAHTVKYRQLSAKLLLLDEQVQANSVYKEDQDCGDYYDYDRKRSLGKPRGYRRRAEVILNYIIYGKSASCGEYVKVLKEHHIKTLIGLASKKKWEFWFIPHVLEAARKSQDQLRRRLLSANGC